jgi:putative SOS response-associated peptidase YedK
MCNRYSLTKKQERIITREHGSVEFFFMQRFNIAPTQNAQVVVMENGKLVARELKWGWETKFGLMTNVKSETAHQKFKDAMEKRRCVVPTDGFYEWKKVKPAQPYRFVLPSRAVFWMAGLWQDEEFAIVTTAAAGIVRSFHDRMPVVLPESRIQAWLTEPLESVSCPNGILASVLAEPLEAYPVTTKMSNPRFDSAECVEPIVIAQGELF